jgi:hypothetical protein
MLYENDQQDATVWDNLLFLGCSTCFERYFRSSSGASKLYYSFWCVIPEAVIQFRSSWWWAKISLKTCRAAKDNKLSCTFASYWSFSYVISWYTETWISRILFRKFTNYRIKFCNINYSHASSVGTLERIFVNIPKDGLLLLKSWQTMSEREEVSSARNLFAVNMCGKVEM